MKVALLCSGLGNVRRGHEVFAQGLFELVRDSVDITLFKGGGETSTHEFVIENVPRNSPYLANIHVAVSPKWAEAVRQQERIRIECETFAYASLKSLLQGGFDIIHCLEEEACNVIYSQRHLFEKTPKIVFSNGGAIPAKDLPQCDFVQEYTEYNLSRSALKKAFLIPHGVDLAVFDPDVASDFRLRHSIPADAFVVISVGTICYWHKRMDYIIRELAALKDDVYLVIIGEDSPEAPAIKEIGRSLMGERVIFERLPHDQLPSAYAAADVFVLGSLFETFGIVYIEAMAMELPIICTDHPNQRSIVKEGLFVDMRKAGAVTATLRDTDRGRLSALGKQGRAIARQHYDLATLKSRYVEQYKFIASTEIELPAYSLRMRLAANAGNALRKVSRSFWRPR
jgi:glycosyltransferase involved in cell wall biosynthesis